VARREKEAKRLQRVARCVTVAAACALAAPVTYGAARHRRRQAAACLAYRIGVAAYLRSVAIGGVEASHAGASILAAC